MKESKTSPLSFGGFFFLAKNSPIKILSNPLTTSKNSPNSNFDVIIPEEIKIS